MKQAVKEFAKFKIELDSLLLLDFKFDFNLKFVNSADDGTGLPVFFDFIAFLFVERPSSSPKPNVGILF